MITTLRPGARLSRSRRHIIAFSTIIAMSGAFASPASALVQSWNGYKWARTGPLVISVGNNLNAAWTKYLAPTATEWSAANNIDYRVSTGATQPLSCNPVYATVQVCNANYGATGWLGYSNVWLSRGFIVQGTVRLNDYYFAQPHYNTVAWRDMTICHELGHNLGLNHSNTIRTNANTGSCMDYTNDPTGTAGTNGTLANTGPNSVDFEALDAIYANLDTTQLAGTKPNFLIGAGFSIDERDFDMAQAVPEPANWAMLIAGFGMIGAVQRRQRLATA